MTRKSFAVALLGSTLIASILQTGTAHAATTTTVTSGTVVSVSAASCSTTTDLSKYVTMEGVTNGASGYVFIVFSAGGTDDTVLTRWLSTSDISHLVCVDFQTNLSIGHGNDIAYQADWTGGAKLMIPLGYKSSPSTKIAIVDPWTLTVSKTISASHYVSGVCYTSSGQGRYAIRNGGNIYTYGSIADMENDKRLGPYINQGDYDGTGEQGLYCNSTNIYTLEGILDSTGTTNYIRQYNWTSTTKLATLLYNSPVPKYDSDKNTRAGSLEAEGIFQFNGGSFFVGVNRQGKNDALIQIKW